jgi:hypothetical protein
MGFLKFAKSEITGAENECAAGFKNKLLERKIK